MYINCVSAGMYIVQTRAPIPFRMAGSEKVAHGHPKCSHISAQGTHKRTHVLYTHYMCTVGPFEEFPQTATSRRRARYYLWAKLLEVVRRVLEEVSTATGGFH